MWFDAIVAGCAKLVPAVTVAVDANEGRRGVNGHEGKAAAVCSGTGRQWGARRSCSDAGRRGQCLQQDARAGVRHRPLPLNTKTTIWTGPRVPLSLSSVGCMSTYVCRSGFSRVFSGSQ
jgi:hypothetical protein